MAEFELQELEELIAKSKTAAEALEFLKEKAKSAGSPEGLEKIKDAAGEIGRRFNLSEQDIMGWKATLVDAANEGIAVISKFQEKIGQFQIVKDMKQQFSGMFADLDAKIKSSGNTAETVFAKGMLFGGAALGIKPAAHFAEIGKEATGSRMQIEAWVSENEKLLSATFGTGAGEAAKNLGQHYDAVANLERGLLMTAAATGNLNEMYNSMGGDLSGLTGVVHDYNTVVTTTATATGNSAAQTANALNQLMRMPGMMKGVSEDTNIAGNQLHILEGAMTFAAGSGQKLEAVMEDMSFAANALGLTGEDSLQFLDRMATLANDTGLPLEKVRASIKDLAGEFAMLTNNTDGTVNIFGQLAPALARANVAPDQMIAISKQVTQGINSMTTAQKAFLSSSTGGPGGLQGAFQIEQMLADGKQDEVFAKVQANLKDRMGGGPIVTREDAGNSPEMAAQYQKQLMYMTSPAMGGIAKDDRMAEKLLKAMSTGDIGGMSEALTAGTTEDGKDQLLNKSLDRGYELQQRGNTTLTNIFNTLEYFKGGGGQIVQEVVNSTFGGDSTLNADSMAKARGQSATNAEKGITVSQPPDEDFTERLQGLIATGKEDPADMFADLFSIDTKGLESSDKRPTENSEQQQPRNEAARQRPRGGELATAASINPFNPTERAAKDMARGEERQAAEKGNTRQTSQQVHLDVSLAAHCQKCTQEIASIVTDTKIGNNESKNRRATHMPP